MTYNNISKATLFRLPLYLDCIRNLPEDKNKYVSSAQIAASLGLSEIQVRKDLSKVCSGGKPRIGYETEILKASLTQYLGYSEKHNAVIVGAGHLGEALLYHSGFERYGFNIIAAFDTDKNVLTKSKSKKPILNIEKFSSFCKEQNVKTGIITVPDEAAQSVCDLMCKNDISAIWNFSSVHLKAKSGVFVQNENMALSLALLSGHLTERISLIK